MSVKAMECAVEQRGIAGPVKLALVILADDADKNSVCWPSNARLAELYGVIPRNVQTHTAILANKGLIEIHPRHDAVGRRMSNI